MVTNQPMPKYIKFWDVQTCNEILCLYRGHPIRRQIMRTELDRVPPKKGHVASRLLLRAFNGLK